MRSLAPWLECDVLVRVFGVQGFENTQNYKQAKLEFLNIGAGSLVCL
jgi:hypothetical protein